MALSPADALDYAIVNGFALSGGRGPGYVVERMPADVREALERLTSKDALNVRPVWLDVPWRGPARRSHRWDKF